MKKDNVSKYYSVHELVQEALMNKKLYFEAQQNIIWGICMLIIDKHVEIDESPMGSKYMRTHIGPYTIDIQRFKVSNNEDGSFEYYSDIHFEEYISRVSVVKRDDQLPNDIPNELMFCIEWQTNDPWCSKYHDDISFSDELVPEDVFKNKYIYLMADILDELDMFCTKKNIEQYSYCSFNGGDFVDIKYQLLEKARLYETYWNIINKIGKILFEVEYDSDQDLLTNMGRIHTKQEIINNKSIYSKINIDDEIPF